MVLITAMELTEKELVVMFVKENGLPPFALDTLRNTNDCEKFSEMFLGNSRAFCDDLIEYKKYCISNSTMTLDKFLALCLSCSISEAFETAFFQSFSTEEILIINEMISNKSITLEEVYRKFEKNPNRNIMRYFKS